MSTYTGSAFATKYAAYLIYKGSATAAALNISQPKIGYVYDITEGGALTPGNITVQQGDAVVYLAQGWTHCNNGGADQAIADLSSQFDELLEEIGETDFSKFALKTELPTVPTDVSAFNNDAGYLTEHQSLANYALKTEIPDVSDFAPYSAIPHNVSQLNNDAHYLTEAVLNNRVRKVDDLAQDTDATHGEIVQLTTDGRFYRFAEPQAEGESGTWTVVNQPADIASNDQILSQNNSGKLTATLGMSYNSTNQHLELKGNNGAVVAYVDMAVFIKDGSNVDLTSAFVKAATYSAPAIGDSMDVAIGKLLKGHEENAEAIATKQNTLTFDSTPTANSTNPVTSQGIKAAIDAVATSGLKLVDLEVYEGTPNEIVKHNGRDTTLYKNGYDYKKVGGSAVYPSDTLTYSLGNITPALQADAELFANITDKNFFKTSDTVTIYADNNISAGLYLGDKVNVEVGDTLYKQPNKVYDVTRVDNATYPYEVGYAYGNNLTVTRSFQTSIWRNVDGIELISYTNHSDRYKQYPQTQTDFPIMLLNDNKLHLGIADEAWIGSSDDVTPPQSWQQWNSQPSSEGAVSNLETRMSAAETAISGKQDTLTFDDAPTANSGNVVKSGGVKTAIDAAPRFYLGTCSTAGNVAIKQVDIPNFPTQLVNGVETPIVGSVIAVKFANTDSHSGEQSKIKVNNTSAYSVWYSQSEVTEVDSSSRIFGLQNRYIFYLFDGNYWVWVNYGRDNDTLYTPQSLGFGYASCTTAAATAAKTASLSNYELMNNGLVVVYFQYDVPAQATLNINSQGAKEIHFGSSRITSGVIKSGDKCLFVYNGNYMLIAIDRWGKELQEKVSGINISETDFESLSTYEQGKLYFVYDNS